MCCIVSTASGRNGARTIIFFSLRLEDQNITGNKNIAEVSNSFYHIPIVKVLLFSFIGGDVSREINEIRLSPKAGERGGGILGARTGVGARNLDKTSDHCATVKRVGAL